MYRDGDIITTRRYAGETYTFIFNESIDWTTKEPRQYITCETPENAFGYPDAVLVDFGAWYYPPEAGDNPFVSQRIYAPRAYTLHRHLPRWILKKIEKTIVQLTDKHIYSVEVA